MKHIEAISKRSLVSDVGKRSWPIPCFDPSSHFDALDFDPSSHDLPSITFNLVSKLLLFRVCTWFLVISPVNRYVIPRGTHDSI